MELQQTRCQPNIRRNDRLETEHLADLSKLNETAPIHVGRTNELDRLFAFLGVRIRVAPSGAAAYIATEQGYLSSPLGIESSDRTAAQANGRVLAPLRTGRAVGNDPTIGERSGAALRSALGLRGRRRARESAHASRRSTGSWRQRGAGSGRSTGCSERLQRRPNVQGRVAPARDLPRELSAPGERRRIKSPPKASKASVPGSGTGTRKPRISPLGKTVVWMFR